MSITKGEMDVGYAIQTYFASTVSIKIFVRIVKVLDFVFIIFTATIVSHAEEKESVSITNIEPIAKPAVEKEYVNITEDDMVVKNVSLLLRQKPRSNL